MTTKDTQTLKVDLITPPRSYDIVVGNGVLGQIGSLMHERLGQRTCIIVTDSNVAPIYLRQIEKILSDAKHNVQKSITIPAGESSKQLPVLHELMNGLFERGLDRKTILIALGGGVVGDLVGFAASIIMRGVDFVQVPTTLLSQVDSSVGGKTGINSIFGKNTIGTFYQPRLVVADVATLNTLPHRELLAGYAEVVKYGLINDPAFFEWCVDNGKKIIDGDEAARIYAVRKSCANKADVVEKDEREAGLRALLNFGHTFGHALESVTGFSDTLLHGEGVAIGMELAFRLSVLEGLCPASDAKRVHEHFVNVGLPVLPPSGPLYEPDELMRWMAGDKKAEGGKLTLILVRGIGQAFVTKGADPVPVRNLWYQVIEKDMAAAGKTS